MKLLAPFAMLTTALLTTSAMAAPNVVASIKPVHSLVASVMAGLGEPTLIVKGSASPHTYALKPSDAGALESADIVFWTGHGMELFLGDALDTLATNATVVELADSPGITLLPVREGGAFEAHSHEGDGHEEHDHEHEEHDRERPVEDEVLLGEPQEPQEHDGQRLERTRGAHAAEVVDDDFGQPEHDKERIAREFSIVQGPGVGAERGRRGLARRDGRRGAL